MSVIHEQHIGRKDNVALNVNGIFGGYRTPCGDVAIVLYGDLDLVVALHAEMEPSVLSDFDAIPQLYACCEIARNLTRIVERQVAALTRKRVGSRYPKAVQSRQDAGEKFPVIFNIGRRLMNGAHTLQAEIFSFRKIA